jgi:biotin transport system substrate-specific component
MAAGVQQLVKTERILVWAVGPASRRVLAVVGFCMLTALLAQVRVPLPGTPVPMTLQVLGVLLAGLFLSPALAGAAMGLYIAAGTLYAPLYAPGSAGLVGVTGGYLLGFVPAAMLVAWISGRSTAVWRNLAAAALGTAVVFVCGVAWQCLVFGQVVWSAIAAGVLPFLPKAAVQLGVAVAMARAVRSGARREFRILR